MSGTLNRQAAFWLLLWTAVNMAVTLINKAAFSMVNFPYPYALTAIHMAVNVAACHTIFASVAAAPKDNIWVELLGEQLLQQTRQANATDAMTSLWLYAFSVLFTLNIALGNVSLKYVSINFHQVMRSLVPVLTLGMSIGLGKKISQARRRAVWPVVLGVALACGGDYLAVTMVGFFYTLLGVVLASAKVVVSAEFMVGPRQLHPLVLLSYMAPAALVQCMLLSVATGEATAVAHAWKTELSPATTGQWWPTLVLLASGFLAFSLNICALQAYKLTSPLTCCIAAAVKQILMIIVGTFLFATPVTPLNAVGIVVVLVGSAHYSYVSVKEKSGATQQATKDDHEDRFIDEEEGEDAASSRSDRGSVVRR